MAVAEHDARQGFHLNVLHRIALDLCKVADLCLGELNVFEVLTRELIDAILNFSFGQLV
jgi:hypothetical protein